MIRVWGMAVPPSPSVFSGMERTIYSLKAASPVVYSYGSLSELRFELAFRGRTIEAARALYASGVRFATYSNTRGNEAYWIVTPRGGLQLRTDVSPSAAIRDIFANGLMYAFECAAAMVVVLYRAALDMIGERKFDTYFRNLLLWDWNYDSDLWLITLNTRGEAYPGDIVYFKNPDVSDKTPWWQGENAVKLDADEYYGHGIGIRSAEDIIAVLNKYRKPGSVRSAYLLDQTTHPDYKYLYRLATGREDDGSSYAEQFADRFVVAKVGTSTYVRV